jgi:hypothetical protein
VSGANGVERDIPIACICPPDANGQTRHPAGDVVTLKWPLGFREVMVIRKSIGWAQVATPDASPPAVLALLVEAYVTHCIESWTVLDGQGKPVPVTEQSIRDFLLPTLSAFTVGDAADDLYTEAVIVPLLVRPSKSSQRGPISASTYPLTGSQSKRRKPSKPSSTTSTQTDGTATTGP